MERGEGARLARRAEIVVALALTAALSALVFRPGFAQGAKSRAPVRVSGTNITPHGTIRTGNGATALGFCGGDDWEPDIATDATATYVYAIIAHYPGDPTCDPASGNQNRAYIRVSADGGKTWGALHVISDQPAGTNYPSQVDVTDSVDNTTGYVYATFLAYNDKAIKTDVIAARSTDHGATWTATKINHGCTNCDHPWVIARNHMVYVAYDQGKDHYIAMSKDDGLTWTESLVGSFDVVAFAEGAVTDAAGNVYYAWGDCTKSSCNGNDVGDYNVSRTVAGTLNTTFAHVATAPAGPKCPYSPNCGFAFFGIQDDIGIDAAGTLYVAWQDGADHTTAGSPPIVQLSKSTDGGRTWVYVGRADDKDASGCAGGACYALFPRVEGGTAGHVDVMWMDDRNGSPIDHTNGWNVWLRTSTTGGTTWTGPSRQVSTYDPNRRQSRPNGYLFPYGDYEDVKLVGGNAYMLWGEGIDYYGGPDAPGAVVYRSMTG